MKKLTLIAAGFLCLSAAVAAAGETKILGGCEVKKVENGNYFNRVDPTCVLFGIDDNKGDKAPEREKDDEGGEGEGGEGSTKA